MTNEFRNVLIPLQLSLNNGDILSSEAGKVFAELFYSHFNLHYVPSMGNNSSDSPKGHWKTIIVKLTRRLAMETNKALRILCS